MSEKNNHVSIPHINFYQLSKITASLSIHINNNVKLFGRTD